MLLALHPRERTSGVKVSKLLKSKVPSIVLSRWYLKLKCANCGEIPEKWQYVDQTEKQPLKGGRGEACAVIKCKVTSTTSTTSTIYSLTSIITTDVWQRELHRHLA